VTDRDGRDLGGGREEAGGDRGDRWREDRPPKTVAQLLAAKDIVIACGPGGVGKTTTAAALAAMAVVEQGGCSC
jgi:flagellar biosynthesis GTPase FlhF